MGPAESLGQVDNLTRLRPRNHSIDVRVFAAFEWPFLVFSNAFDATLLLLPLFLFAGTFSLAFVHAFFLSDDLHYWRRGGPPGDPPS